MADHPGALLATWSSDAGAALVDRGGVIQTWGDVTSVSRVASISKLVVGYALLVALEEGSVSLDDPAGPPGATLRHLLAHASGLAFDSHAELAPPGTRRIYSNTGIEVAAAHLASATGIGWANYVTEGVLHPLGLSATVAEGSPAADVRSNVSDLARFATELLSVSLIDPATMAQAITEQFAGLGGVLPGFGVQEPNPWGLAFELRGSKRPHWTGQRNSGATFGHFGGSGTFLWVDPALDIALIAISGRSFGPWALDAWPAFSDAVIARLGVEPFAERDHVSGIARRPEGTPPQDPDH
jgi:CubicO group peptidase (beta-lactamase class C family)